MKQTTLCYLIKNDDILMMHRNKKTNDPNHGKWIGIGGHIEKDEHLYQAMKREVLEETGLDVKTYHYHGVIFFE
ncbi:MAG: DNA mismatch repair protein MutT, partial [Tenericutes bacterium HGW-Tenericutes-3]